MRNTLLFIPIFICFSHICSAQKDSSIIYFNKEAKETTKDSAYTYVIFTKNNDLWHGKVFYSKNHLLQSEGDYAEMNYQTPMGTFQNYKEALHEYITAISEEESLIIARGNLAVLYRRLGLADRAAREIDQAVKISEITGRDIKSLKLIKSEFEKWEEK